MELFYRIFGSGKPVIILHGLYGMSDNWHSIGKSLSGHYSVIIPDQRNHGRSPHSNEHNYEVMKQDLLELFNRLEIDKAMLIGHSMGAKTAALFAIDHPQRISKLVLVDMSPKAYTVEEYDSFSADHKAILSALQKTDIANAGSRKEVEEQLEPFIPNVAVRHFLLKNLRRDYEKKFYWSLNIEAILNNLRFLLDGIPENAFSNYVRPYFPVLFVKGARSNYLVPEDFEKLKQLFPKAIFKTIEKAGHWVHAEQPKQFLEVVDNFLQKG
jgi:esterase